jgi:hypothetical protein
VRAPLAIVCAALALGPSACTIGPATGDGGTGGGSTVATRSLGDQCTSVLTAFCQKAGSCAVLTDLNDCISGNMSLCCVGAACTATSTVSEADVSSCEQSIANEDCNVLVNTTDPTSCLTTQ